MGVVIGERPVGILEEGERLVFCLLGWLGSEIGGLEMRRGELTCRIIGIVKGELAPW